MIGLGLHVDLLTIILLLVGGVLIVVEMLEPGIQIFGPAGIVSLVVGSLLLLRLDPSKWLISQEWYNFFFLIVVGVTATMVGLASIILYKIFRIPKHHTPFGGVVGEIGRAIDTLRPNIEGHVQVKGEYWRARATKTVEAGQSVRVLAKEGAVLTVEPVEKS